MKKKPLVVHVVVDKEMGPREGGRIFSVIMREAELLEEFYTILTSNSLEKAMIFALAQGRCLDHENTAEFDHLTLRRDRFAWDIVR